MFERDRPVTRTTLAHSDGSLTECRRDLSCSKLDLLWNKLAMPQDTHDQESNAPSVPL